MRRNIHYVNNSKKTNKRSVNLRPVIYTVLSLILFLLVQLLTLSFVGTKGSELAAIREEQKITQENIRQLRASISNATSLDTIEKTASGELGMKKVEDVKYLNSPVISSQF